MDRVKEMAADHPEWKTTQPFQAVLENDLAALAAAGEHGILELVMATHAGMTTDEFAAIVGEWIQKTRHPRFDRPYTELVYQPMLELLDYLRANGFKTFIVSGGGIEFMRPWVEDVYGIVPEQVIGSRIKKVFEMRDTGPVIVRLAEMDFIDDKEGKPVGIHNIIGRRPIAAFGNSDGDLQMLQWTAAGSGRRLMGLVHHTDAEREWAYDRDSHIGRLDKALTEARDKGWTVVDMKNDWGCYLSSSKESVRNDVEFEQEFCDRPNDDLDVGRSGPGSIWKLKKPGVTPPPGDLPVPVTVGVYLIDITNIDETRNTFDVEMDVAVTWTDSRLAFDPAVAGSDRRVYVGAESENFFKSIWTAQIGVANPVGQLSIGQEKISVFSDGRVEIEVRVGATCRSNLDFRHFPFDQQALPITLESFAWNKDVVELIPDLDRTGFAPEFALAEWEVESLAKIHRKTSCRVRDHTPFSNLKFEVRIERNSGYYVWKIFLTVFIIVCLTFVVFFMSDERLGRRAGVSSTGILTVIAYQFVTTASLPRVSYLTVADRVMMVSIITVAATMAVSIVIDRISLENMALRLKIDRICRWVFPVVYLLVLSLVIGQHWVS